MQISVTEGSSSALVSSSSIMSASMGGSNLTFTSSEVSIMSSGQLVIHLPSECNWYAADFLDTPLPPALLTAVRDSTQFLEEWDGNTTATKRKTLSKRRQRLNKILAQLIPFVR